MWYIVCLIIGANLGLLVSALLVVSRDEEDFEMHENAKNSTDKKE